MCPPRQAAALSTFAFLSLLLCTCVTPRPLGPPAEPPGARRLLRTLEHSLQHQSLRELVDLFTPECRASCRGFVPHPVGARGSRIRARWTARLQDGDLLEDLARALLSYGKVRLARIEPRQWRSYEGLALLRAELTLSGEDRARRALEDRGLIDLALQRGPAGWRIARLVMAQASRTVELRPDEVEALAAGAGSRPTAEEPPSEAGGPAAGEPSESRVSAGGGLLPADLLALNARRAAGGADLRISELAGERATLLLISEGQCSSCASLCRKLAELIRGRRGCVALHLRLGSGRGGCALDELRASARSGAALGQVRSLLPLVVLVDAKGRALRMVSGATSIAELEAELDRHCAR